MFKQTGYVASVALLTVGTFISQFPAYAQASPQVCPPPPPVVEDVIPNPLPTVSQLEDSVNNFYTSLEQRQLDVVAKSYSDYYLQTSNQQASDLLAFWRKQDFDGYRLLAHTILKETKVSDITYIVSLELRITTITPTEQGQSTQPPPQPTNILSRSFQVMFQQSATQDVQVYAVFRFENGTWKSNDTLVDYYPQNVKPQTINGVTVQPETVIRYSDQTKFVFCLKNINARKILWTFGQPAATFYFGSNQITTPSDSNPVNYEAQSVDSASSVWIQGFSTVYPTAIDVRSWHFTESSGTLPDDFGAGWTYKFKLQAPTLVLRPTPTLMSTPES